MEQQVTISECVLFLNFTAGQKPSPVNWQELAVKYGFSIVREKVFECVVNAHGRALARLTDDHPEIQITYNTMHELLTQVN